MIKIAYPHSCKRPIGGDITSAITGSSIWALKDLMIYKRCLRFSTGFNRIDSTVSSTDSAIWDWSVWYFIRQELIGGHCLIKCVVISNILI